MAVDRDALIGRWTHSHEEDSNDHFVFRRDGYDFPLSRGRRSLEFRSDRSLIDTAVGAADVSEPTTGTWSLDGDELTVGATTYRVVAAEPDRLVLARR